MKIHQWIAIILVVFCTTACFGDDPTVPAEHAGVFFKGGRAESNNKSGYAMSVRANSKLPKEDQNRTLTDTIRSDTFAKPYAGIRLTRKDFTDFLVHAVKEGTSAKTIEEIVNGLFGDDLSNATRLTNARAIFCIQRLDDTENDLPKTGEGKLACQVFEVLFNQEDEALVLLVRTSYNVPLVLEFKPSGLPGKEDSFRAPSFHSKPLIWKKRFSLEASSDLTQEKITLLTGENREGVRGKLEAGYAGFGNPLSRLTRDASYYDFTLNAKLSEFDLDEKSSIELGLGGISDWKAIRIPHLATIISTKVSTSQSFNRVNTLYDLRYRLGDKRTTGRGFYAADEALKGPYMEFGTQIGYSINRHINDKIPDGRGGWLLRPVILIGLAKQDFFGAEISGNVTYYYLPDKIGRATISDSWGETFDLSFAFGPKNQQLLFSVTGGRNAAEGFVKITPTYSLGIKVKM